MTNLVIVESPAKAKTIKKYLGTDFEVLASFGHVRQLPRKNGAVNTDNNFDMEYQLIERNAKHVNAIVKAMEKADTLYLATDPDREGEAISWHLSEILQDKKLLTNKQVYRVAFHEITKEAIQAAIANPGELSMNLVDAQRARLALDYLVGFTLSPLLWKKIRSGLSAGRVQSPALRLIVEREQEIQEFKPREYWTIEADCNKDKQKFVAKLNLFANKKITQFSITNETKASEVKSTLIDQANAKLEVTKVDKKQRKRQASAPFTTSTLQQEAARKLGFTTKRTMQVAQQLYEGIDIGNGAEGLISYMRTDSVNLANEALEEIREVIVQRYGEDNLPKQPRTYKTKAKNAQEAHEAIRPTAAKHYPEQIKQFLKPEQLKLYTLIWRRTIACQMIHATLDTVAVDLSAGEANNFRANGSTLVNPGFMAVYQEGIDDEKNADNNDKMLPALVVGDQVSLNEINNKQHFTEPAPRFTEASLVKSLEEFGIGRPSTYANIISTLQQREYVVLEKKRFTPTDIGSIVNRLLTTHFSRYVDYDFTAQLEDDLDAVSRGEKDWIPLMEQFWSQFKQLIDEKMHTVERKDFTQEAIDESCPKCKKPLVKRLGKRGKFIGCTAYPDCDYTRSLDSDGNDGEQAVSNEPEIVEGRKCPKCKSVLHIKLSRTGSKFIGCSNYPKCKHLEPLEKPEDTGIKCPSCNKATLVKKKSRYGKYFYSCSTYPKCKYAIPNEPIKETCPTCDWRILMLKTTKRRGTEKLCPQKECDFIEAVTS